MVGPRELLSYIGCSYSIRRPRPAGLCALASAMLACFLISPLICIAAPGTWSGTASPMNHARMDHTATPLADGTVLVAGGWSYTNDPLNAIGIDWTSETFDPSGSQFPNYLSWMHAGREGHTATLLPNGNVLVAGGLYSPSHILGNAEIYHSATYTWSETAPMKTARYNHTAILLPSGNVLVTGGSPGVPGKAINTAELYDWTTGTWSDTGSMSVGRIAHTATLLPDGRVLVAGGYTGVLDEASAEIYDPLKGTWTSAHSMNVPRSGHTATLMRNGLVLVVGGMGADFQTSDLEPKSELYWPWYDTWVFTGKQPHPWYDSITATLLWDGKVLVVGGRAASSSDSSSGDAGAASLYDPATLTWSNTGSLSMARWSHTASLLSDGRVLVAGGCLPLWPDCGVHQTAFAEIYEPVPPPRVALPPLLGFYPFDGNAQDASDNGRHGTITGAPNVVEGHEGQAYHFNGWSDYIAVPVDINPSKYPRLTIGAWAKTKSSTSIQPLVTHDDGGYDRQVGIDYRGGGTGWSAFGAGVLGAVPAIYDKWTFVAVVYNQIDHTVRLQVDDMVLTQARVSSGSGMSTLYIGASPTFKDFFDGVIDNVFIFGDALSDGQLAYIRSGGAPAILTATKNRCAAILDEALSLHVPVIVFNGQHYWADFQYAQSSLGFVLSNAGLIVDTSPFSGCQAATLSLAYTLHMPEVIHVGDSYWADLQYIGGITFALVNAGFNLTVLIP